MVTSVPTGASSQGTRKGCPYHGPTRLGSRTVHGRGTLYGYLGTTWVPWGGADALGRVFYNCPALRAFSRSFNSRRRILPEATLGIASMNSTM